MDQNNLKAKAINKPHSRSYNPLWTRRIMPAVLSSKMFFSFCTEVLKFPKIHFV
jgi:hypothetical protein